MLDSDQSIDQQSGVSMGAMGDGYGSEAHLLRFLGRHRNLLNEKVLASSGGSAVDWLDFGFDRGRPWQDAEITGLDFLPADAPARTDWGTFWPTTGTPPTWDAIAKATISGVDEWLLVEAKANVQELASNCKAKPEGGLTRIAAAMDATKAALCVPREADWLHGYYQFCKSDRGAPPSYPTWHSCPPAIDLLLR